MDEEEVHIPKSQVVNVPVIGKVTAGIPITAVENIDEYFPLPDRMVPPGEHVFMLEIMGESMIDAGIFDKDYVIVKQQNTANNGEIVVAMTEDDEATVKRFYKEDNYVRSAKLGKSDDGADYPAKRKHFGESDRRIQSRPLILLNFIYRKKPLCKGFFCIKKADSPWLKKRTC